MPYDIRVIRSKDFLHLDAEGHFDMYATRQFLADAMWACARSGVGSILLDVRDAEAHLTTAQLRTVACVCRRISPPSSGHRIAILTRPHEPLERASLVAGLSRDGGWNIRAFVEFEEAFMWLAADTPWPSGRRA